MIDSLLIGLYGAWWFLGVPVIWHAGGIVRAMNSKARFREVKPIPMGIIQVWVGGSIVMCPIEIFELRDFEALKAVAVALILSGGLFLIRGMAKEETMPLTMTGTVCGCAVAFTLAFWARHVGVI